MTGLKQRASAEALKELTRIPFLADYCKERALPETKYYGFAPLYGTVASTATRSDKLTFNAYARSIPVIILARLAVDLSFHLGKDLVLVTS